MWKNQGSWNFSHAKLIPNSSIILLLQVPFYVTYNCYHTLCLWLARLVLTLRTRRANHKHQSTEHS